MCIYQGYMGIFLPNMKVLCVTLWLRGVCTDNADANDDTNDDDAQSMTVKGSLVDKPNKPKSSILLQM